MNKFLLGWALGTLTYHLYRLWLDIRQAARLHRALVRGVDRLMGDGKETF